MEPHEFGLALGGAVAFVVLYEVFTARVLPLMGARWKWIGRRLPKPDNFCPRCEHLSLRTVYHFDGISDPPVPRLYLCQHCGARWKRFFTGPLETVADKEYDEYTGPEARYRDEGLPHNGKEPMPVIPFEPNWVKCPNCGWRFRLDSVSWSGYYPVHVSCGQRLIVTNDNGPPTGEVGGALELLTTGEANKEQAGEDGQQCLDELLPIRETRKNHGARVLEAYCTRSPKLSYSPVEKSG